MLTLIVLQSLTTSSQKLLSNTLYFASRFPGRNFSASSRRTAAMMMSLLMLEADMVVEAKRDGI